MEVYMGLDNFGYMSKPGKWEIVEVKKRVSGRWGKYDLKDAADMIGNRGHAFLPGHLIGGKSAENCQAMQIFSVDFDGGVTFQEVKEKCEDLGLPIAFAYHTLSHSEKMEKFRIVFVHEYVIAIPEVIEFALEALKSIFPESDQKCFNKDRLFLGGKELIYYAPATIALVNILHALYKSLDKNNNFPRNLRGFSKKIHIPVVSGNHLAAGPKEQMESILGENDGNIVSDNLYITEEPGYPSFFIIRGKEKEIFFHQSKSRKMRNISISEGVCRLVDDYVNGEELDHNTRFAILTNLMQIEGGRKLFFEILEKYYPSDTVNKSKLDIRYMKGYSPQRCSEEFCPYYKECNQFGTIVDTLAKDRKVYVQKEEYYSLEEVSTLLRDNLMQAISSRGPGIHLIKAQTAVGKTTQYIEMIQQFPEKKFIVALPTNILKKEVEDSIRKRMPEERIFVTGSESDPNPFVPSEIQAEIKEMHARGFHNMRRKIIQDYYEKIQRTEPYKEALLSGLEKIMKGMELYEGERIIVTTHAYFMSLPESFLEEFTVIIDEDILRQYVFRSVNTVSVSALKNLAQRGIPGYARIAEKMETTPEGIYTSLMPDKNLLPLSEKEYGILNCSAGDNINDLRFAATFVKMRDRESGRVVVKYFCPAVFPGANYIVMSATLNEKIYAMYFRNQMKVYSYPEKKAQYRGNLIQYTYHSLGRLNLAQNEAAVIAFVKTLKRKDNICISFKSCEQWKEWMELGMMGLHFGNAIGVNSVAGKDMVIVGTPFDVEESYKLLACYLGENVNAETDKRPRPRRVEYNGKNFVITTYEAPLLREIQLYFLESEIEQCVGRARLLRNTCTVYLLSAMPADQAQIDISDYLNPNKKS